MRRLVLVAGPSGSGKTRLARRAGVPTLRLDDFYLDGDHPDLPRTLGIVDWDDPRSWDLAGACRALQELVETGRTNTPEYSISENRRVSMHEVDIDDAPVFLAEGIFAVETALACAERGVVADLIWLDRSGTATFVRRLHRDLRQHRKPAWVLVRRGLALWREEAALRQRAVAAGFEPCSMRQAERRLQSMVEKARGEAAAG